MKRSSSAIHDCVNQSFQLLDPVLSKILVLIMWLTLTIIYAVGMQNFLDWVTNLHLSSVTNKLGWSTSGPDLIFQSVDELPISLNGIDISNQRFNVHIDLS